MMEQMVGVGSFLLVVGLLMYAYELQCEVGRQ